MIGLAVALAACSGKKEGETVVHFEVENMTSSNVGLLIDRTTGYMAELDKKGRATLRIEGMSHLYPMVIYGQSARPVFVARGSEVTLRFDGRRMRDAVQVEGPCAEASQYLQTNTLQPFDDYALAWGDFLAEKERRTQEAIGLMKARKLDPAFTALEEERLGYLFAQTLILYPMGYRMMGGDAEWTPPAAYYDELQKMIAEREELADVEAYRDYLRFAIPAVMDRSGESLADPYKRTVETMRYIGENFRNEKVKQTMIRSLALEYLQDNGVKNTVELQNLANAYLTDERLLSEFRAEIEEQDPAAPGKPSPGFEATDAAGKVWTLADLKGKYVYIDMWATWCGPCKQQLPYLKKLAEEFEGRNIVFVGLSVDKDRAAWEKAVAGEQLPGVQLYLGPRSSFQQDYGVNGIPRFILLDPEGRIVDSDMLRPSDEDTARLLNELEGI